MNSMSGKQLAKLLEEKGWILLRIQGSHPIYGKPGIAVRISVPIHGNKSLKVGLLKNLLKMAGLSENAELKSDMGEEQSTDSRSAEDVQLDE